MSQPATLSLSYLPAFQQKVQDWRITFRKDSRHTLTKK